MQFMTTREGPPRSECTKAGIPKSVNSSDRHLITVLVFIFGQGKTNGKRETH